MMTNERTVSKDHLNLGGSAEATNFKSSYLPPACYSAGYLVPGTTTGRGKQNTGIWYQVSQHKQPCCGILLYGPEEQKHDIIQSSGITIITFMQKQYHMQHFVLQMFVDKIGS
jgi:hypothetical protein